MAEPMELPDEVAMLWGRRAASRRGPKPTLTIEAIVAAAIEVADAEGLAAVSMARVASYLGNAPMALYRHVDSKDELLRLMADAAIGDPPDIPTDDWRAGLSRWAHAVLAIVRSHPWYARLPIKTPPIGPHDLAWLDRALSAMADTGLREDDKLGVVMGLSTFVQGEVRLGLDLAAGFAENPEAFSRQYGQILHTVVDPLRMPALHQVVAAGVFDMDALFDENSPDADFDFGLERYLDGVAAYIAARAER